MTYATIHISEDEFIRITNLTEGHFLDFKAIEIKPANITKTVSAFANAAGGEIFVGIEEIVGNNGKQISWRGFSEEEDANGLIQAIEALSPLANHYSFEFLQCSSAVGLVAHISVNKTHDVMFASDGVAYIRRGAQKLPVVGDEALRRLRLDKGLVTFEDETLNIDLTEVSNSLVMLEFILGEAPNTEPQVFLERQQLIKGGKPSVAAILLYHENPQGVLPKRSAIKIIQYKTRHEGERDTLAFNPISIEGHVYELIYCAVEKCKEIVESIQRLGLDGLERISYPEEALHEIVTNAVLHRDYSIAADVQIRIYDNRIEIESPGRLPGHINLSNILESQFARNPKLVRLVNRFPNPPNKDIGEGLNTTFAAMEKLRLKPPVIEERNASIVVTLRHEPLDSPEQVVMEYIRNHDEITNYQARQLTGIKSENSMKNVFYRLRDRGLLEQVPERVGRNSAWRKPLSS